MAHSDKTAMSDIEQIVRKDYATGKPIKDNPEEKYRQEFEHVLIDDLGYPKDHIDIEVPLQRGSNRRAEEVDIVVYNSSVHKQENAYMIIEIEHAGAKYDLQAFSYATATTAPYCVWYSGLDDKSENPHYLYRDLAIDPLKFNEIPTLPRFGETFETIGRYRKQDLKPAKALKLTFQRIYNALYGSGPIKREQDIATEVIKLIFCKILDEQSPNEKCEFRATPREMATDEGLATIRSRIEQLYSELLRDPDFGDMFKGEKLEYDNRSIAYVVSELQGLGLMDPDTNTDALGDAYEVLLPSALKGESGQFFTPREVVRFAMDIIAPDYRKNEIILDPACGSGGFLSVAIEKLRKQIDQLYEGRGFTEDKLRSLLKDYAGKYIFGCDIDRLLYRITKSYMAIVGDGRSNIFNLDSLLPFDMLEPKFKERITPGSVDIITTNPPFGTKIDDTRDYVLESYELGHALSCGKPTATLLPGQDPDKLFLERDLQYLKSGSDSQSAGRMVIVLPRQNLSGSDAHSVELRRWLLTHAMITAIVDLPREAFQPHTGTKTSLVFLEKRDVIPSDYPLFMAVSESVGHDRRGNPVYVKGDDGLPVRDESGNKIIWNDLPEILAAYKEYHRDGTVKSSKPSCFEITVEKILNDPLLRLDAWYWDPDKNELAKTIEESVGKNGVREIVRLGDLTVDGGIFYPGRHKRNYISPESEKAVPFYSGTQILQIRPFDLKYQPVDYRPARNHFVKPGWILITRSGSTGRVVMTPQSMDGCMVSEHVIRVVCDELEVDPYYVYAFLSSEGVGKVLLEKGVYASVVDHISPDFVATIPIPRLAPEEEKAIADEARQAELMRDKANQALLHAQHSIESVLS